MSTPVVTGPNSSPKLNVAARKLVGAFAASLIRMKKADEADQSCEGRTKGDLRSLICGTCKTFYDEPPTKGQLDALVKAALCHLDDLLRAEEQPTAAPAAAEGARAQKPSALWQWGIPEPSQKKAARDCERSTTEKCTSVKT